MKMNMDKYHLVPFPQERRLIIDVGWMAQNKPTIYGLLEIDVTTPRQLIRDHKEKTGERLSFAAYLAACLGRAVDSNKKLHAYQDWLGRLVLYQEVDIATMIEVEKAGKRFPIGHIIRAANKKSFREIHKEIRSAQRKPMEGQAVRWLYSISALPRIIRRLLLRVLERSPRLIKRYKGTVILTSVGMFMGGSGWGLSLPSHTLGVTVGSIIEKPGIVGGRIEAREYLHVTLDFDHNIVDGAPAARFTEQFRELVENGYGLA